MKETGECKRLASSALFIFTTQNVEEHKICTFGGRKITTFSGMFEPNEERLTMVHACLETTCTAFAGAGPVN